MIEHDGAIPRLVQLGLTRNEARVYVALLRAPQPTAAELAEIALVPRPKVYAALRALEMRGFCAPLGGPVTRFTAAEPTEALHAWVAQRDHERELASDVDREQADGLLELLPSHRTHDATSSEEAYFESVSGRPRVTELLEQLISDAEARIFMIQQPPYFQPPSRWNVAELEAVGRRVVVRVIYGAQALEDDRRYRPLIDAGVEVRYLDRPSMKLAIRDGSEAVVALRDPVTKEQGVTSALIRHPDLVAAIELLFEKEWDRARPIAV